MNHFKEIPSCEPPRWAKGGHAQTLLGHLLPSPAFTQEGKKLCIALPDGDSLSVRVFEGSSNQIVYLFHGLGGDIGSDYMGRTAQIALRHGHTVWMVNHRGCGEGFGSATRPYHSGRGEDLSEVIREGRKLHPSRRHLAVGFSLSGNALLCLLTGLRGEVKPDAAIAVNAPIDLAACAVQLTRGFNRLYDFRFVQSLKALLVRRYKEGSLSSAPQIPWRMTLMEFDNYYTAPAGGFVDNQDYYASCSTKAHLHKINVPTVILTAADDPFIPVSAYRDARLSNSVHLHIEETGGHMGYLTRAPGALGFRRWLDEAVETYMVGLSA